MSYRPEHTEVTLNGLLLVWRDTLAPVKSGDLTPGKEYIYTLGEKFAYCEPREAKDDR